MARTCSPGTSLVISDPDIKKQIREGTEKEEREFYERRTSEEWLEALASPGIDWRKPILMLATGYPTDGTIVPDISKKQLGEIASFI